MTVDKSQTDTTIPAAIEAMDEMPVPHRLPVSSSLAAG